MRPVADWAAIRGILETDRNWAVYALADLAPELRAPAEWHIAREQPALLLLYRGFHPPVLFALGDAAALAPILPEIAREPAFYLSVRPPVVDLLRAGGYEIPEPVKMWRMVLDPARFAPRAVHAVRLGPPDCEALTALHRDGDATGEAPLFFEAGMLRHGVYYGIWEGAEMVAAAGTHVLARGEGVAGIGNVYTRRDRRGRGLGAQVTAAVTAELLDLRLRTIALNVAQSNAAAMAVYERLGFTRYCEYREGRARLRQDPPAHY